MFEWRGPAPFYFVKVDSTQSALIKERAQMLSCGWGVVHIHGEVNGQNFQSALIPKDGCYYIPIKDSIRKAQDLMVGDRLKVHFNLGKPTNL